MMKAWACAFGAIMVGCTGAAEVPPSSSGAATPTPAPAANEPAKPESTKEEETPATAVPSTPPTDASPSEDWLVWWFRDGTWRTRWLRIEHDAANVVGERQALIVGDAGRIWQIERADTEIDVKTCLCDGEDPDKCPVVGKVGNLGLRARELDGEATATIVEAKTEAEWGDGIERGLAIVGGSQARLTLEVSESGYFCGAHGLYFTDYKMFDVAMGAPFEAPTGWWKRLPEPLRRAAAQQIEKELNDCNESNLTTEQIMNERLDIAGAMTALKGGVPTVTWKLAAEVMYICSPDYAMTGTATSGLIAEAAPIGLAGPLPAAVAQAVSTIGEAESFGFSKLTLAEPARAAKIAAFTGATERTWPAPVTKMRRLLGSATQAKLDEGRKLTRAKDYAKAIAAFDAAIAGDADAAQAYSGRGYAHMLAGEPVKAKADFDAALARSEDPRLQAAVWFNVGTMAQQANDPRAARSAYAKSQALRPSKQAADALAALGEGKE